MKALCLAILLTVWATTGCGEPQLQASMRTRATKTQMASFRTALEMFRLDCGRLPTTAEGLDALVHEPTNVPRGKWKKYLDCDRIPTDVWNHPYMYRCSSGL